MSRQYETKKQNNSFDVSSGEESFYVKLCQLFSSDNIIRQHKDDRCPFSCVFYIKSLGVFIELNYSWTHGFKLFESSQEDLCKVAVWQEKAKTSEFYKNAIDTWTRRDVQKMQAAKKNNLKYPVYYSEAEAERLEANLAKLTA